MAIMSSGVGVDVSRSYTSKVDLPIAWWSFMWGQAGSARQRRPHHPAPYALCPGCAFPDRVTLNTIRHSNNARYQVAVAG